MTELVIRIDPARVLQAACDRAHNGWRYVVRTLRTVPMLTRFDCNTHVKIAIAAAAAVSIILIYSASRAITATPSALKHRIDDAFTDTKAKVRVIEIAKLEPKPVKTERILPLPAQLPPVEQVPDELPPLPPTPPTRKRYAAAVVAPPVEHNICTRHNLRKVITNGGKSWRCRR